VVPVQSGPSITDPGYNAHAVATDIFAAPCVSAY
jgi:hypothetical protein